MQTNTRKKYCFTPTRMAIIKKSDNKVSGMLRNRNSHTHPCEVPSHSEQDIGEMTSQLCQKMERVVTCNIRLQKTSWLLSCPPVNHSLWVKPTARSWGHSTSLREKPPWWDPANSQHSHAHHVQHGRRSVPPAKPSDDYSHDRPWATTTEPDPSQIPDPETRCETVNVHSSLSLLCFGVTCCAAIGSVSLSHKMQSDNLKWPNVSSSLEICTQTSSPHNCKIHNLQNLSTAGAHWTALDHRGLLPLPSKPHLTICTCWNALLETTASQSALVPSTIPTPKHGTGLYMQAC